MYTTAITAMVRNRVSAEVKQCIIDAHNNGDDYQETARLLGVKRGTAYSIVSRHIRLGVVQRPRGGGRRPKLDQEMKAAAVDIVEESPEFTLEQINAELRTRLPNKPRISIQTLSVCLQTN